MIEGEQMSFWDLPDKDETAANVDAFLKGQINRLARQAGCKLTDIASLISLILQLLEVVAIMLKKKCIKACMQLKLYKRLDTQWIKHTDYLLKF